MGASLGSSNNTRLVIVKRYLPSNIFVSALVCGCLQKALLSTYLGSGGVGVGWTRGVQSSFFFLFLFLTITTLLRNGKVSPFGTDHNPEG